MRTESNELVSRFLGIWDIFHEFESKNERTYCSIFFSIFTKFRAEVNELVSRFLAIFTDFRPEWNKVISRFLAIFSNLRPPCLDYFHETSKYKTMSLFLSIFQNLRQKELNYYTAPLLAILTNLVQKVNLLWDFWSFSRISQQNGINLILDFCNFFFYQKGILLLLDF